MPIQPEEPAEYQIIYVSTFPPRVCGIATFTQDLTNAMDVMLSPAVTSRITAMNPDPTSHYRYPRKVLYQIVQGNPDEYITTARKINEMENVPLVNIQHEFGIFGGERGAYLIPFMQELDKPICITMHTVLPGPDEVLHDTVVRLADNASTIIVMTNTSKEILSRDYAIPKGKIKVVPHGIHARPYTTSEQMKKKIGYADKVVLSTFGLLSRNKGLEYVIEALPRVVSEYPDFVYIIFGATHPEVLRREGESYRNSLTETVNRLHLNDYVKFYNRYFPLKEMLNFLEATDIYISPSLEPNQAVSGTLSYALGTGRPVISTAFAQAKEDITDEVGLLVDFRNPDAYADAILHLLHNEESRVQKGKNAYFRIRNWTWSNVALQYSRIFAGVSPALTEIDSRKSLPAIKLDHLKKLTDNFGIVQFAILTRPDPASGYTLDDNARALTAAILYLEKIKASGEKPSYDRLKRELNRLIKVYLAFIEFVARPDGEFPNYIKLDKNPDHAQNSKLNMEESNGRAVFALTLAASSATLTPSFKRKALRILQDRINTGISCGSPRAVAHCVKSLCILISKNIPLENINLERALRTQANHLIKLYNSVHDRTWEWFEPYLTYSNGIMPEAMFMTYDITENKKYLNIGRKTLDFLIEKSFIKDTFMPIGQSGWHYQNGRRYKFDQQPEEVRSIIYALKAAYLVTGDEEYRQLARRAFNWFLGDNSLRQVVYDHSTGGCYDGVGQTYINLNQGAESTISYLLARLAIE